MNNNLPVVLLKKTVILPSQDIRLDLSNETSKKIIDYAINKCDSKILIVCSNDPYEESPELTDLLSIGVESKIKTKMELPNGSLRIVVSGIKRRKITKFFSSLDSAKILMADTMEIELPILQELEETTLRRTLLKQLNEYIETSIEISNSILSSVNDIKDIDVITDLIVSFMPFSLEKKILYMGEVNPIRRANALIVDLNMELEVVKLDNKIDEALREDFDKNQKEFLLREKLKSIRKELGEVDTKEEVISDYLERINDLKCDGRLKNKLINEVRKLDYTNEASPEVTQIRTYLDLVLDLPFGIYSEDETDLKKIKASLDETHFGLDKVKNRVLEYIAVKSRNKSLRSPILCLVGPPGVGKTTLAMGIANALNKEFYKISVGGLNDSALLNGHRRTYIGSSPGKIIEGLKKCGTSNPLILIDEIDKMVKDYRGDPASVLLDILDKEQNYMFTDNYLEEPFDLSEVMFVLTANYKEDIPEALYDRLEILELSSYTEFQKLDIAKNYLIPNIYREHLVCSKEIRFPSETILEIINKYTKEAGVRDLQRNLSTIVRKIVTKSIREGNTPIKEVIRKSDLPTYLGMNKYDNNNGYSHHTGMTNALAYTPLGGIVTPVEAIVYDGKEDFKITGMVGESMEESVNVALSYIKSKLRYFKIKKDYFTGKTIHIHFLEGAIKKDGPSAGVAIVTALLSLFKKYLVKKDVAMTGEVTLNGDVLKVGGIKEKIIGAYNNGIRKIYIPNTNIADLEDIPSIVKEKMEIILVKNYRDIYKDLFDNEDDSLENITEDIL